MLHLPQGKISLSKKEEKNPTNYWMHSTDVTSKLLMELPCKNGAAFTRVPRSWENFEWKQVAVKGRPGLMGVWAMECFCSDCRETTWGRGLVRGLCCMCRCLGSAKCKHVVPKVCFPVNTLLPLALGSSENSPSRLWAWGEDTSSHRPWHFGSGNRTVSYIWIPFG